MATDAPVDLSLSLVSSLLTLIVFFQVLANLGGTIVLQGAGLRIAIPGYLAISVLIYSGVVVTVVLVMGRRLTAVIQDQIQAEAAFRSSANLVRESGEGILLRDIEKEDRHELWLGLHNVIEHWRRLCWQLIRITFVSQTNLLLAPVIGLLLCVPKYLAGEHVARRSDAGCRCFRHRPGRIELVRGQFPAHGRLAIGGQPGCGAAAGDRRLEGECKIPRKMSASDSVSAQAKSPAARTGLSCLVHWSEDVPVYSITRMTRRVRGSTITRRSFTTA